MRRRTTKSKNSGSDCGGDDVGKNNNRDFDGGMMIVIMKVRPRSPTPARWEIVV